MSIDLVRLVDQRFGAFTAPYLEEPGDHFAYRLKIKHTRRVLAIAEAIVQEEALPPPLALASRLAALMHDVGRFPQYRQYHTFRDAVSANHAALSVTYILREHLLEGVPNDLRRLVLGGVYLHNKRSLPPLKRSGLDTVARVVRDSDKLDIFQVMINHFSKDDPKHPEVVLHVIDEPQSYTEAILRRLRRREPGDYRDLVYVNDFKLMSIGWLYDLNFRASCRMLKERGYLDALFSSIPRNPDTLAYREQIEADLAERLAGA